MFQLIVQFQETHVFEFGGLPTGREIKDKLFEEEGVPADLISLSANDCDLLDEDLVDDIEALTVRASLLSGLCGGKGGFGAQLRALAKQKAYRKTTDFGACRDLSGRRLRHVNDEILLQKWQEAKDKGEAFEPDGETATGIDLWYLSAPSWAEGVKVDKRKIFMKPRMKTAMCIDWKRARENRPAPEGAPAHWGCPRGRRCEFAHGVEELRGESQQALLDAKQQERRDVQNKKKDDYMGVLYRSNKEEEELEDLVMAGLRAAKRAKLNTSNTTDANTTDANTTNTTTLTENDDAAVASDAEGLEDTADSVEDEEVVSLDYFTALSGTVVVAKATTSTSTSSTSTTSTTDTASVCPIVTGTSAFATVVVDKLTLQAPTIPTTTTTTTTTNTSTNTTTTTNTTSPSRWYYEVELQSDGLMQLGWVDSQFIANFYSTQAALPINTTSTTSTTTTTTTSTTTNTTNTTTNTTTTSDTPAVEADGVGDDAHSWGYDGYRQQRWHGGESSVYGPQTGKIWQAGDVVGCYLELYGTSVSSNSDGGDSKGKDKKRKAGTSADNTTTSTTTGAISYSLNGVHFGTAFDISITTTNTSGSTSTSELLFYPAFSLEDSESVLLNLGSKPFKFDPSVVYSSADSGCTSVSTSSGKKGTPAKGKKGANVSAADKERVVFVSVWEAVLQASGAGVTTIDTTTTDTTTTANTATTSADTTTTTFPPTTTTTTSTTSTTEVEHTPIHLEDALYATPESLESLGLTNLKQELTLRGMKTGGTLQERAVRLFSVRGVEKGKIDAKLLAKKV